MRRPEISSTGLPSTTRRSQAIRKPAGEDDLVDLNDDLREAFRARSVQHPAAVAGDASLDDPRRGKVNG